MDEMDGFGSGEEFNGPLVFKSLNLTPKTTGFLVVEENRGIETGEDRNLVSEREREWWRYGRHSSGHSFRRSLRAGTLSFPCIVVTNFIVERGRELSCRV